MSVRHTSRQAIVVAAAAFGIAALPGGCGMSRQAQLEAVAKDWCMTIRASQVIPVYPLTQDVQPGDVYLVQTTIDRQQEVYKDKGFLPLDNHLARLQPTGYTPFYDHSFFHKSTDTTLMPARWGYSNYGGVSWSPAPGSAFPTYSFSVKKGAGLNLAVPVSGVPVGMSLMGTQAADGSVSIKQARTIGVDTISLYRDLSIWAERNTEFLKNYRPGKDNKPRNFLRVITRVYSTGAVTVALSDARSAAGGLDAGVPRPVDLLTPQSPRDAASVRDSTLENYRSHLAGLNAMLAESRQPSRQSGSSAGLGTNETEAKTAAKQAEIDKDLLARKAAVDAAESELAAATSAAMPMQEKVRAAQEKLAQAEEALRKAADEQQQAAAKAALDQARADLETADSAASEPLKQLAAATGKAEFARNALTAAAAMAPGGSLRVTAASSRFISMDETFDPPLIIGYLGFDVPILAEGKIGAPVPTQSQIESDSKDAEFSPQDVVQAMFADGVNSKAYVHLKKAAQSDRDGAAAVAALDALAADLPSTYTTYEQTGTVGLIELRTESAQAMDYPSFKDYRGAAKSSLGTLTRAMSAGDPIKLKVGSAEPLEVAPGSERWNQLVQECADFRALLDNAEVQARHHKASLHAGTEYLRLIVSDTRER